MIRLTKVLFVVLFFTAGPMLHGQSIVEMIATPDSLDQFVIGDPSSDQYALTPYGKHHVLFLTNTSQSMLERKDPFTRKAFPKLAMLRIKDLKEVPFNAPKALTKQPYYIGQSALLPDSSGIIVSQSKRRPNAKGRIGLTLSMVSFNGNAQKVLPFVDPAADYQHPYFDEKTYTLYFSSNIEGGKGGYDLYSSELSFDGVWSVPTPVEGVNSVQDEIFPTVTSNGTFYFSRATKNYGLQLLQQLEDKSCKEIALNGRGDDFSMVVMNDSTAVFSQSKRPGSPANLMVYQLKPRPKKEPVVAIDSTEVLDSAAIAVAKADSIAAYNASQGIVVESTKSEKSNSWVTDATSSGSTSKGYSLVVGGFVDQDLADSFLESISGWAPEAFLARYNNKYYIIHSVHQYRADADKAKASVNKRDYRAWVLGKKLETFHRGM